MKKYFQFGLKMAITVPTVLIVGAAVLVAYPLCCVALGVVCAWTMVDNITESGTDRSWYTINSEE